MPLPHRPPAPISHKHILAFRRVIVRLDDALLCVCACSTGPPGQSYFEYAMPVFIRLDRSCAQSSDYSVSPTCFRVSSIGPYTWPRHFLSLACKRIFIIHYMATCSTTMEIVCLCCTRDWVFVCVPDTLCHRRSPIHIWTIHSVQWGNGMKENAGAEKKPNQVLMIRTAKGKEQRLRQLRWTWNIYHSHLAFVTSTHNMHSAQIHTT